MSLERILLAGFVTTGLALECRGLSRYEAHFHGTWSASSHPEQSVPNKPGFSALVAFAHVDDLDTYSVGSTPTKGLENLAELGGTAKIISELEKLDGAKNVVSTDSGIPAQGDVEFEIEVDGECHSATVMSMVAPSPDWFVKAEVDFCNHKTGQWLEEVSVTPPVFDAGTDAGILFESANLQEKPRGKITEYAGVSTVATLKFTRTGGCGNTMDCTGGTVCAQGYCVPPCLSSDDCNGETCDRGYCGGFTKEYYVHEGICPAATRPLWSRSECNAAAIFNQIADTKSSNVKDTSGLRGCYELAGELKFNDRAPMESEGPTGADSICTNDGGNYVNAGATGGCGEFNKIRNREECAIAAGMLGLGNFRRASSTGSRTRPAGCFIRGNGKLYFNKRGIEDYQGVDSAAIICSF